MMVNALLYCIVTHPTMDFLLWSATRSPGYWAWQDYGGIPAEQAARGRALCRRNVVLQPRTGQLLLLISDLPPLNIPKQDAK